MSRVELAIEKVRKLNEDQIEDLLDWLELRENPERRREWFDAEIEKGLAQVRDGQVIPGEQVHADIRERSRKRRMGQKG
jgi:hypothetical protein